jgi:hypothetical protein
MPKIQDLRLTFIWVETTFDLLNAPQVTTYPFGLLGQGYAYKDQVSKLLGNQPTSTVLTLPWAKPAGNRFWTYYLEETLPGHIKPSAAWEKLVPLRRKPPVHLTPQWAPHRTFCEGYYYPFGFALAITLHVTGNYTLTQAIQQAHLAYRTGLYDLEQDGQPVMTGKLNSVALACLGEMRRAALGPAAAAGAITPEPLTVVTVVRGSGVNESIPLESNPQRASIQRSLEALCNWQPNYKTIVLPPLNDPDVVLDIRTKTKSPGDVLYAGQGDTSQGRVVWFPGRFQDSESNAALSCYHRNLVMGALHTESLARFARQVQQEYPAQGYKNSPNLRWCTQKAATILGDLYVGKDRATYRSDSLRKQIEKGGFKPVVSQLLVAFGEDPLA